jgi:hypothetical protein
MSSKINTLSKLPWIHQSEHSEKALRYIKARQKGLMSSLKLPWKKLNKSAVNGLEINTVLTIAGRPANGKSLIEGQFARTIQDLNPQLRLRILQLNFEMLGRSNKIRELTSVTKKSYAELLSADEKISNELIQQCEDHFEKTKGKEIDVIDESKTVDEIEKIIRQYMEHHCEIKTRPNGSKFKKYRNTVITLDHSLLVKLKKGQTDKKDMLFELGEMLNVLKKEFPIWFIILSQLNRNIAKPERNKDGQASNYPTEEDLYGADALMQFSDYIYIITCPHKRHIKFYGPDNYIIEDDTLIAVHIIKSRNGLIGLTFLKATYSQMRVDDTETPLMKPRRTNVAVREGADG